METKKILWVMLALTLMSTPVFARAERMEIKRADYRAKERAAKAQIKNINLKNIEDPEARKAIQEVFNYLNLQSQK